MTQYESAPISVDDKYRVIKRDGNELWLERVKMAQDTTSINPTAANTQTFDVNPPHQLMYEADSAKEWQPFSNIFFKTLKSEAKDVPFSIKVERVDGVIHWRTYLIIGENAEHIEVSDVHTDFEFYKTYSEYPSGAETLAMSMPLKRLLLAFKAYVVNKDNPNCVEIIKNALELETEAAKERDKEREAYYNRLANRDVNAE